MSPCGSLISLSATLHSRCPTLTDTSPPLSNPCKCPLPACLSCLTPQFDLSEVGCSIQLLIPATNALFASSTKTFRGSCHTALQRIEAGSPKRRTLVFTRLVINILAISINKLNRTSQFPSASLQTTENSSRRSLPDSSFLNQTITISIPCPWVVRNNLGNPAGKARQTHATHPTATKHLDCHIFIKLG